MKRSICARLNGKSTATGWLSCSTSIIAPRDTSGVTARNPGGLSDKLTAYFEGDLSIINTLPTATAGTPFQREVWQALRNIPCGQVMHYGQLAEQLGRAGAARAVGAANGSNPVSIVVPCHRVIGRNGTLTGYAGGVQRKEWLLRHEGYFLL